MTSLFSSSSGSPPNAQPGQQAQTHELVIVQCQRLVGEPPIKLNCWRPAAGVLRVEMWPHQCVQALVPHPQPLLSALVDLSVCHECYKKLRITDVMVPELIHQLEDVARRQNHGYTVDRSLTKLVLVPFDHPELKLLRDKVSQQPQRGKELAMENQHKHIKGYRDLSAEEIALMNDAKDLAARVGEFTERLKSLGAQSASSNVTIDGRWLSIAVTDLQKGFMSLVRSIAQPTSF